MSPERRKRIDASDHPTLLRLWFSGYSQRQLAEYFDVSGGTIQNTLKRLDATGIGEREGEPYRMNHASQRRAMGENVKTRMRGMGMDAELLAVEAGVDQYQVDQILWFARKGTAWCPPQDVYDKLYAVLWPTDSHLYGIKWSANLALIAFR